jgi:hypothetical protein
VSGWGKPRRDANLFVALALAGTTFEIFEGSFDILGGLVGLVGLCIDDRFGGDALAWRA